MITLQFQQCYPPCIVIYHKIYYDKNNNEYFKGRIQSPNSEIKGFIVRPDFYDDWINYQVAEININLTEKGASVIDYNTFESLEKKDGRKFIETTGTFFDGTYLIDNPISGEGEKTTFISGPPNRKSLKSGCNVNYFSDRVFSIRLISDFHKKTDLGHAYDFYYSDNHWSARKKYLETKKDFVSSTITYYIVTKVDFAWQENFREGAIRSAADFGDGEEIDVWKYSIVFDSLEEMIKTMEKVDVSATNEIFKLKNTIEQYTGLLSKEIEYAKSIKKIIEVQIANFLKLELSPIGIPDEVTNDSRMKMLLSKIQGVKFNSQALAKGFGLNAELSELGVELDEDNNYMSQIYITIIVQV